MARYCFFHFYSSHCLQRSALLLLCSSLQISCIDIQISRLLIDLSFIVCPHIQKRATSDTLTTKNRKEGGGFVPAGTIFTAQSHCCLWLGKLHHFCAGQQVNVGSVGRQAGLGNKQSSFLLDVYDQMASIFSVLTTFSYRYFTSAMIRGLYQKKRKQGHFCIRWEWSNICQGNYQGNGGTTFYSLSKKVRSL